MINVNFFTFVHELLDSPSYVPILFDIKVVLYSLKLHTKFHGIQSFGSDAEEDFLRVLTYMGVVANMVT